MTEVSLTILDIFNRVFVIFALLIFGVFANKLRLVKEEAQSSLAEIIITFAIPCVVFISMISNKSLERLSEGSVAILISAGSILIFLFITKHLGPFLGLPPDKVKTFQVLCTIPNTSLIGYPIVLSLLGQEGLIYAVLYDTGAVVIFWTGIVAWLEGRKLSLKKWQLMIKPPLVALAVGILVSVLRVNIPGLIKEPLSMMGAASTPLAMLVVGYQLAGLQLQPSTSGVSLGAVVLMKLVIFPLLTYGLTLFFHLSPVLQGAIVIQSAMPSMASTPVLIRKFGGDPELATAGVVITTLLSIIFIPCVLYVLL